MKPFLSALMLAGATAMPGLAVEPAKEPQAPTPVVKPSGVRPLCFVFAGESNSGGIGLNTEATAAELAPRSCVQIMNLTSGKFEFESLQIGVNNLRKHRRLGGRETTCHGFELELANAVDEGALPGHRQVHLIKTGQGGSRVQDWAADRPDWQEFRRRIEAGRKQLPADVQWVVWLSLGINDALAGNKNWKAEMSPYLDRLQQELPGAVIVMTGFQSMGYPEINKAIVELAAGRKGLYAIDSTGAGLIDKNHWNYAGLKLVARRLIESTRQALKTKQEDKP
jgi:hypothetical protein